ncbi:MAG: hypothetical protein RL745_714 [Actinomycetota bacterium]|jgi:hypothetical protein
MRVHSALRTAFAGPLVISVAIGLAGCWQGNTAATYVQSTQGATGDGVEKNSENGQVGVRGALIVAQDGNFSVIATLVNKSAQPERLVSVAVGDIIINTDITIPASGTAQVGHSTAKERIFGTGLLTLPSAFVPVQFQFGTHGPVTAALLVRAPEGYWKGIPVK